MFEIDEIVNSFIASFAAGILLVTSAPIWWKWVERITRRMDGFRQFVPVLVVSIVLVCLLALSEYLDPRKGGQLINPAMTDEEFSKRLGDCEMRALEAVKYMGTGTNSQRRERRIALYDFKKACLSQQGIKVVVPAN